MFRKNEQPRQQSFITGIQWPPDKLRQDLHESWAGVSYTEMLYNIEANEQEQHLQTLGDLLSDLVAALAQRVLAEQPVLVLSLDRI